MVQTWNTKTYAENARFVSDLGMPVVEWLKPQAGERILDLGCGDGALTLKIQELGCEVVGVDASPDFVQFAQSLGLDARLLDGHALDFNAEFDAVFSNAALHWMKQPNQVIESIWRALKSGGRFVGEFGGDGNVAKIVAALQTALKQRGVDPEPLNPWYFPTVEDYQTRLQAKGFRVNEIVLISRPTPLPTNLRGWLATFANPFITAIPTTEQDAFLAEVTDLLKPDLCDVSGQWIADYMRLRFSAVKPLDAS